MHKNFMARGWGPTPAWRVFLSVVVVCALPILAFAGLAQVAGVPNHDTDAKFTLRPGCTVMDEPGECDHCVYTNHIYYKPPAFGLTLTGTYVTLVPPQTLPGVTQYHFTGAGSATFGQVPAGVVTHTLGYCDYVTETATRIVVSICNEGG